MQLHIGNKNYSSWSMRPWVMLKQAGIAFDEVMTRFDSFEADSNFKREIARLSGAGRVPLLVDEGLVVWDTLAIAEYVAERFPDRKLWPVDRAARARARSVCAEMHSGFGAMRSHFGMNIEAALRQVGARVLKEHADVRVDVDRITSIWTELLEQSKGPMLFGDFSIADAYFAPVVMRFRTYGVPLSAPLAAYCERVVALPGVAAWIADALAEQDFLPFEEAYRTSRTA
jgi:glutathione S-transferase